MPAAFSVPPNSWPVEEETCMKHADISPWSTKGMYMSLPSICLDADRRRPVRSYSMCMSLSSICLDADRRSPAHGGAQEAIATAMCMSLPSICLDADRRRPAHGISIQAWNNEPTRVVLSQRHGKKLETRQLQRLRLGRVQDLPLRQTRNRCLLHPQELLLRR